MNESKKDNIRKKIWNELEKKDVARFPKPVEGRIPNFEGAKQAASKLSKIKIFDQADNIKVNPDSPQNPVRAKVIEKDKVLYMPTPRLKNGFLKIEPDKVPSGQERKATTIKHSNKYGVNVNLEKMEDIDLVITGSVAVTRDGKRVGKGGGYSDIEYAIIRELDLGEPPVISTVHPIQIVEDLPFESHDVPIDWIVTPKETIKTESVLEKPKGIDWEKIESDYLDEIPLLNKIKDG